MKAFLFVSTLFCASTPLAQAFETAQLAASLVTANPSLGGAEVDASLLMRPLPDRALFIGPHFGLMGAGGGNGSRFDILVGGVGTIWIMNAIGLGAGVDLVPYSGLHSCASSETYQPSVHLRLNPFLAIRTVRYQDTGAWAIRFGITYDTVYQWGAQVGIALQLSSVPNANLIGNTDP